MPFQHQAGATEDDGVHNWSTVRRMAPARMTVASFNFKNPRGARASRDSLNRQGAVPQLEVYENTGSYGLKNLDDGELLAQRRMAERDPQGQLFNILLSILSAWQVEELFEMDNLVLAAAAKCLYLRQIK